MRCKQKREEAASADTGQAGGADGNGGGNGCGEAGGESLPAAEELRRAIDGAADLGEALDVLLEALRQGDGSMAALAEGIAAASRRFPRLPAELTERMVDDASLLSGLSSAYGETGKDLLRRLAPFRRRMLDEFRPATAAETMLVEAAVEAYHRWMRLSAICAKALDVSDPFMANAYAQARLSGAVRSAFNNYTETLRAIGDIRRLLHGE